MSHSDLLARAVTDLKALPDALRWVHGNAYFATKVDRDRPTGRAPEAITEWVNQQSGEQREPKPRPTDDVVGDGDPRSRVAYQTAIEALALCHDASIAVTWPHTDQIDPTRLPKQGPARTLTEALATVGMILRRLERPLTNPKALHLVVRYSSEAWLALDGVLSSGSADPDSQAVGERCNNPHGACPENAAEKKGGRCHACYQWKYRNGYERPANLCASGVAEATQAQARRLARGESFGDESLSCTQQPPIIVPRKPPAPTIATDETMVDELEAVVQGLTQRIEAGFGDRIARSELRRAKAKLDRLRARETA